MCMDDRSEAYIVLEEAMLDEAVVFSTVVLHAIGAVEPHHCLDLAEGVVAPGSTPEIPPLTLAPPKEACCTLCAGRSRREELRDTRPPYTFSASRAAHCHSDIHVCLNVGGSSNEFLNTVRSLRLSNAI